MGFVNSDVRLRIPNYTLIPEGPLTGSSGKDIIFRLQASRIQKDVDDSAQVLVFYGRNSEVLGFSQIKMIITVTGVVLEDGAHVAHPVTTAVEHDPDFVDMEEAAVAWNNAATPETLGDLVPQLEIEHGAAGAFRVYKGLIGTMELVRSEESTRASASNGERIFRQYANSSGCLR